MYHFFKACIAFLLYLDDITNAFSKNRELVILKWYFGERMENNSASEKDKISKEKQNFVHYYNRQMCTQTGKKVYIYICQIPSNLEKRRKN